MRMVLMNNGKYYVPMWATRGKSKIMAYWDNRFCMTKIPIEEGHFTYPKDGDFHYTFYTNKKTKCGIRQFCDKLQYLQDGKIIREVVRTESNQIFDMQPLYKTGWKKLPLNQFTDVIIHLILPISGFGFPINNSAAKSLFVDKKPRCSEDEIIDITSPDKGSFNVNFVLRGKNTVYPQTKFNAFQKDYRFVVEDSLDEPIITLTLLHILPEDMKKLSNKERDS